MNVDEELARARAVVRDRFAAQKRVLSFREYFELVSAHPARHTRDAARYLHDCFLHYGHTEVERPWGKVRRWRLFDLPWEQKEGTRRSDHLVGQEALQEQVFRTLQGFRREGRSNKLLLLHGPNGSAKSTFAGCLMRGLEAYSETDDGARYRFSWIFPRGRDGKGIGFSTDGDGPAPGESYAHLPEEKIDAKLPSEIREHPLLLLPLAERQSLLDRLYGEAGLDLSPPDALYHGQLGHKNRQILDALLTAYRGDLGRVLGHVQVERWYVSRRYRRGAVTIGPEMAVDARERQITADRSLGSLPASLSAVTLFEAFGELVDAQGGMVEYSDLLKRPLDAWRYLLLAIETGEVMLPMSNMPIDSVLVGSSNDLHLRAFQEHPEYQSFRGRLLPLRVAYLRDHAQERGIYDAQIVPQVRAHVAPHTTYVAALWAILTRLRRARAERYEDGELGRLAADLTPLEKAELYAEGKVPRRFDGDEAKVLQEGVAAIFAEPSGTFDYEGVLGASPREMRGLLLDAASDTREPCLSPASLLERIEAFCERDDYLFLQLETDRGYHDARAFARIVRERWLDLVDDEVRVATGLIDETQYRELFERYVTHVSHALEKEQVINLHTGKHEDPDEDLMQRVEQMLGAKEGPSFRRELMSRIAAWAIDHPDGEVDYEKLFPRYIERLEEAYFREHARQIAAIARDVQALVSDNTDADAGVPPERRPAAEATLAFLTKRRGYTRESARVALGALMRSRYEGR